MHDFFDRLQQLGVVETPVRTQARPPDVTKYLNGCALGSGGALDGVDHLFSLDPGLVNMDASTVGAPLRGLHEADEPICSTFGGIRANLAQSFGCETDEIAITNSTTDSISKILLGLDLSPGDEVVVTDNEHFGSLAPLAVLRDRLGIRLKVVTLPFGHDQTAEDILARFEQQVSDSTRLVLFSALTANLGTRLPVREIAGLAQRHGATTLVDAAHVPGMLDIDFHDWGADFAAGSGNKWQCGPPGTGLVYIRNRVLAEYNPNPLPVFWPAASIWYPLEGGLPARTSGRHPTYDIAEYVQNAGAASIARLQALETACEIWQALGRKRIEAAILGLSASLRDRIVAELGSGNLFSPHGDPRLLSGLTAYNPFRDASTVFEPARIDRFIARLETDHGIIVKRVDFPLHGRTASAVRVSTRLYHRSDDLDRFIAASTQTARLECG